MAIQTPEVQTRKPIKNKPLAPLLVINEAKSGVPEALENMSLRVHRFAFRMGMKFFSDEMDAEDIAQETCIKVLKGLDRFEGRGNIEASFTNWVRIIGYNTAMEEFRGRGRISRGYTAVRYSISEDEDDPVKNIPDLSADDPLTRALDKEARLVTHEAVEALPQVHRSVARLAIIDGLSYGEIAELLGIAEGTVKSRLSRGRDKLEQQSELQSYYKE